MRGNIRFFSRAVAVSQQSPNNENITITLTDTTLLSHCTLLVDFNLSFNAAINAIKNDYESHVSLIDSLLNPVFTAKDKILEEKTIEDVRALYVELNPNVSREMLLQQWRVSKSGLKMMFNRLKETVSAHKQKIQPIVRQFFQHQGVAFRDILDPALYNHVLFNLQSELMIAKDLRSIEILYSTYLTKLDSLVGKGAELEHQDNKNALKKYKDSLQLKLSVEQLSSKIDHYLIERQKDNRQYKHIFSYFLAFFSYFDPWALAPKSLNEKESAVAALKESLDILMDKPKTAPFDPQTLRQHLATLRNGVLGETLRAFVREHKADDLIEHSLKKPETVSEFIDTLMISVEKRAAFLGSVGSVTRAG